MLVRPHLLCKDARGNNAAGYHILQNATAPYGSSQKTNQMKGWVKGLYLELD